MESGRFSCTKVLPVCSSVLAKTEEGDVRKLSDAACLVLMIHRLPVSWCPYCNTCLVAIGG
jgi:hypothetical protein